MEFIVPLLATEETPEGTLVVGRALLVGWSPEYDQPMLDFGVGEPIPLNTAQRQAWDADDERFTLEQLEKIEEAVRLVRQRFYEDKKLQGRR